MTAEVGTAPVLQEERREIYPTSVLGCGEQHKRGKKRKDRGKGLQECNRTHQMDLSLCAALDPHFTFGRKIVEL